MPRVLLLFEQPVQLHRHSWWRGSLTTGWVIFLQVARVGLVLLPGLSQQVLVPLLGS